MTTKTLLTLWLAFAGTALFAQLPRVVLQPASGDVPQTFITLQDAIDAAQSNDKLYISGGAFQLNDPLTLDFPIHLIGAGVHPDSTVATNATSISTSDPIVLTTGASNSSFTGIIFDTAIGANFTYGTTIEDDNVTGILFERCEFKDGVRTTVELNNSDSETTFNECIFMEDLTGGTGGINLVNRCVFSSAAVITQISGNGLVVDHCVFLSNTAIANSTGMTVRNSVFKSSAPSTAPVFQCNSSTIQNCLTTSNAWLSNSGGVSIVDSVTEAENPFVNETDNIYNYSDDVSIIAESPAAGGALDGTDMGIYGSPNPAKLGVVPYNPHFIEVEIGPATDGNGNLPVSIKVQAQSY